MTNLRNRSVADQILDTLTGLLLPSTDSSESLRVAKYSPTYRLAFSLLNEDAASGRAILSWDVKDAIDREKLQSNRIYVLF